MMVCGVKYKVGFSPYAHSACKLTDNVHETNALLAIYDVYMYFSVTYSVIAMHIGSMCRPLAVLKKRH